MAETDWAERRRRMVKCKIHGLHYDPEMSTGCARCLREAAKAQPQRSPQLVVILLCLLGMVSILLYVFGPGRSESTGIIDLGVASQGTGIQKLDPEPYREPIETFETVLFRMAIDRSEDLLVVSSNISVSAADLSATILERDPTIGLTAADLIARLGQGIPTDQVTVSDVLRARSQWLRVREQYLQPADWFIEPPESAAEAEAASIAAYSNAASNLRSLIDDGAAEVQSLNEPAEADAGGGDPAAAWRDFARDWLQQLVDLERRLPDRPSADADDRLLAAIQDLERALRQARALASAASPPDALDSRFDEAGDAALRAEQGFDELAL